MIRRNPDVPDNIFELARHETFGDYARAYKDELTHRYENLNILYIPYFPLDFDLAFFQSITFPPEFKKVGTIDGLDNSLFVRSGNQLIMDEKHILLRLFRDTNLAVYVQSQISSVNSQIRQALRMLFPKYYSLRQKNITWRLTESVEEGMHFDSFNRGNPSPPEYRARGFRIKLFINIDSEPRRWRTSYTLPGFLKKYRHELTEPLPDDADIAVHRLNQKPWLSSIPHHEIDYPTLAAVTGEAQGILHEIRYGRRVIAAEFVCDAQDMLEPGKRVQASLKHWAADAGISLSAAESSAGAP